MSRRRRQRCNPDELRSDLALPAAIDAALEGGPRRQAASAWAWALWGVGGGQGTLAAERVLERADKRPSSVTAGAVILADGLEVRAGLTRWGGRVRAYLRTWFRGRDKRWRPTKRGVTVTPEQLPELEAPVRAMRDAYAAGALGPPTENAPERAISDP